MSIEQTFLRIAVALENIANLTPANDPVAPTKPEPAPTKPEPEPEPELMKGVINPGLGPVLVDAGNPAETLPADHEEPPVEPAPSDERKGLQTAISQLIQTDAGIAMARAILLSFHNAEKIKDLDPAEYAEVAQKMDAAFFSLPS